jgi:quercetin dioxygenase-like cupin family protein
MSVVDSVSPPNSGPPRHIHHDAEETFVILSGDVLFWLEGKEFTRGPGQTMFVPRGKQHTFRVVSDAPARHLIILKPGGFEGFFSEMAAQQLPYSRRLAGNSRLRSAHYQLSFTGPPL